MRSSRPDLKQIMMNLAEDLAQRSKDHKYKVGCVVTDEDLSRVIGMGYNGGAKGQSDKRESSDPGCSNLIHAEINALIKTDYSIPNKIIFITHSPCRVCSKVIVNAGVKKLYYKNLYDSSSFDILESANIRVRQLK